MNMLTNLAKASLAVVLSPIALVADIVALPSSAYDDKHPFGRTAGLLNAAGDNIKDCVKVENGTN